MEIRGAGPNHRPHSAPESAGIVFIDQDDKSGPGVRLKKLLPQPLSKAVLSTRIIQWAQFYKTKPILTTVTLSDEAGIGGARECANQLTKRRLRPGAAPSARESGSG